MVVGPNFGHSGVQESRLTQVHRKSRLITVKSLGGQSEGVCPMTPHTDWFHVNVTLVISLMKGGRR
jgi:NADPH-dependent 7-cyano-7-deazaguanine reductase QueF